MRGPYKCVHGVVKKTCTACPKTKTTRRGEEQAVGVALWKLYCIRVSPSPVKRAGRPTGVAASMCPHHFLQSVGCPVCDGNMFVVTFEDPLFYDDLPPTAPAGL